jgi:hypothetical protein
LFLDSNILLSRTLRDWFCLIDLESGSEGIRLRWSEDVLAEFLYHLRKKNPSASEEATGGLRRRLENACPDAKIEGYSIRTELIASGRDEFDARVVAAAEHGRVDYLVTNNIKHFEPFQEECEFEICAADDMLCLIDERRPDVVLSVVQKQLPYWAKKNSDRTLDEALNAAGAPKFSVRVRSHLGELAMSGRY